MHSPTLGYRPLGSTATRLCRSRTAPTSTARATLCTTASAPTPATSWRANRTSTPARHDEMATPSKPAQKTARAVEGLRAGAARNQARVHGERRRGAELDRDL